MPAPAGKYRGWSRRSTWVHHVRMEQIPIGDGEFPDNVVPLPGSMEPDVEPNEASAAPEPEPTAEPAIGPLLEQSARILLGFVSATSAALADALRDVTPRAELAEDDELPDDGTAPARPNAAGLTAGAAAGLAIEVSQVAMRAATSLADTAGPIMSWITNAPVVRRSLTDVEGTARDLNDRWTRERPISEETATAFATRIIPELTNAILDRVDLTQIAIDHLDIDRIVDTIDLDAIVERVDLDAVIRSRRSRRDRHRGHRRDRPARADPRVDRRRHVGDRSNRASRQRRARSPARPGGRPPAQPETRGGGQPRSRRARR